jgi:hypothetical protein
LIPDRQRQDDRYSGSGNAPRSGIEVVVVIDSIVWKEEKRHVVDRQD